MGHELLFVFTLGVGVIERCSRSQKVARLERFRSNSETATQRPGNDIAALVTEQQHVVGKKRPTGFCQLYGKG